MRVKTLGFVITALVASIAPGQRPAEQSLERVFNLTHIEAPQDLQEIATVIRVMTGSRQVSTDDGRKSLALRGTPVQIALAEWLLSKLDQPANRQAVAQQGQGPAPQEYRPSGSADDVARVFYLTHIETPQNLLEVATTARTIGEIRRLLPYSALRAVILRGTAGQVALAEWLLNELDKPANRQALAQQKQGSAVHEYRLSGGADNVARVFYLTHIETPQDLVELATTVRTIGDIRRLYSHNALGAVVVRGTADQVALAEWLFNELDKPANRQTDAQQYQDSATYEYRPPEGGDDTAVRVFYLAHAPTVQRLLEIATQLRRETGVRRLYTYSALKALALRGSPGQVFQVDRLINAQDR